MICCLNPIIYGPDFFDMKKQYKYISYSSTKDFIANTSKCIAGIISSSIASRGQASVMLSGGSSPRLVYEALSLYDLPWHNVIIGLVDDRWVEVGLTGSNETFLNDCLFSGKAKNAKFLGLKTKDATPYQAIDSIEKQISGIPKPFDICVMGMGLDGHTASWFPNSNGLISALDPKNKSSVVAVDATGCKVAGEHTDRISLTYSSVIQSRNIMLLIPGEEKAKVFQSSIKNTQSNAPVKALLSASDRLTVITCESN